MYECCCANIVSGVGEGPRRTKFREESLSRRDHRQARLPRPRQVRDGMVSTVSRVDGLRPRSHPLRLDAQRRELQRYPQQERVDLTRWSVFQSVYLVDTMIGSQERSRLG